MGWDGVVPDARAEVPDDAGARVRTDVGPDPVEADRDDIRVGVAAVGRAAPGLGAAAVVAIGSAVAGLVVVGRVVAGRVVVDEAVVEKAVVGAAVGHRSGEVRVLALGPVDCDDSVLIGRAAFAVPARRAVRSDRRRSRVDCNRRHGNTRVLRVPIHGSHDRCSRRRAYPTKATMSIRACAISSGHSLPVRCQ